MARKPQQRQPKTEFEKQTVRLLAHKFMYYELAERDNSMVSDFQYDMWEKRWHKLGQELGLLGPEDTSPCVGFDWNHPFAQYAVSIAFSIIRYRDSRGGKA